jgi:hypothetical protein
MEKEKLKVDILGKQIDLIHKKILVLLGAVAGSWFYAVEFAKADHLYLNLFSIFLLIVFAFFVMGTASNYLTLSELQKEIKNLNKEIV